MITWRNTSLYLTGIGVSYLGNWIYLIAINLMILQLTGSAAAVAGLYIIKPIAVLATNLWSGSIVDRVNQRKLMMVVDVLRGGFLLVLPFLPSIWLIYLLLFMINVVGAFFGPSSMVYITKVIPEQQRKRFNSLLGMTNSGAFLLGPALAGVLILLVGTAFCIWINAITFFICAFCIFWLPNPAEEKESSIRNSKWKVIQEDWGTVKRFAKRSSHFMMVYFLFQSALLIGFALDSQEVTFIKQNLSLSDQKYGLMVSLTGVGSLSGGLIATALANTRSTRSYVSIGLLLSSIGYLFIYTASTFWVATAAFIGLGFFMAFANAGYTTYVQNTVPVTIMGRFSSVANLVQGLIQIGLTISLGLLAEGFSLEVEAQVFSATSVAFALLVVVTMYSTSKTHHYAPSK